MRMVPSLLPILKKKHQVRQSQVSQSKRNGAKYDRAKCHRASVTEPSTTEPSTTEPNTTDSSILGTQNNQSESSHSAALNASNKTNDKKLPQTNDEKASWMLVLGIMMVSVIGGTIIIRMK
ncbi:LPXTG cell wall anchor domain-containing protein [Enterococcus gallinarum]|uniref:LPXTG cell wall anchor domain-containing protein n=2 Tax=Enterococcus gallinarum TaxID=1353 RepID=UPI002892B125|nr:LPXTG cell wall anchor domain-containing protein [Enterococcus gallinarum]